jgi:hypothetical protein
MNRGLNSILFWGFFLIISSVQSATLTETFEKTLPFTSGNLVSVLNQNGEIEIETWDREEIEIIAYKKVRAKNAEHAEKMMQELEIYIEAGNDNVDIETRNPRRSRDGNGFFSWIFGSNNNQCYVEYHIRVPKKADLNLETTNGDIHVRQVSGRIRMETTNGEIKGRHISGFARCNTTNGSIKIDFVDIPEHDEMYFRTTNGSIRLYLPNDYGGYVDLSTTNGEVDSDFDLEDRGRRKRTHLSGQINSGECDITCSTTNGSIYLFAH